MIPAWLIIGIITFIVALGSAFVRPRDLSWSQRLDRPKWLFFEPAIPVIWTIIFFCGACSATILWNAEPGSLKTGLLMFGYLVLELVTVAYIPLTLRFRSLAVGTLLGLFGVILGVVLDLIAWQISPNAGLFLLPYVIWSPIGTYATLQMIDINPEAV